VFEIKKMFYVSDEEESAKSLARLGSEGLLGSQSGDTMWLLDLPKPPLKNQGETFFQRAKSLDGAVITEFIPH